MSSSKRRLRHVVLAAIAVLAPVVLVSACSSSSSTASKPTITIKNFHFMVPTSVKSGSAVTVKNDDTTAHTVRADDKSVDTGPILPDKTATITVRTAGAIKFHCNIHNYMTATLTVAQ